MERRVSVVIDETLDSREIKYILKTKLFMSQRLISKLKKRQDGILLNGSPAYVVHVVHTGDVLTLRLSDEEDNSENIVPTKGDVDIVYEDDDLLLINKPAGLSVHPSMGNFYDTLANYVAYHYKNLGLAFTFRPINRLDKNTSGLMLVAKNSYAQDSMAKLHREGLLKRQYLALVEGEMRDDFGTVEVPIARADASAIKREVNPLGKYARTDYKVIKRLDGASLLEVSPITGRTHQIRVHMAYIGHPLMGDFLYGNECTDVISRHALHSYKIQFMRPFSGEQKAFEISLPDDIKRALKYFSR